MKTLSERTAVGRNDTLNELSYIRKTSDAFVKALFTKAFHVEYQAQDGFAGSTDTEGRIVLDGKVAEDKNLSIYERADVLKGVLLDEVGHNLYKPLDPYKVEGLWRRNTTVDPKLYYVGKAMLHSVHNLIEDIHNVWAVTCTYPGFRPLHGQAVEYYIGNASELIDDYEKLVASGERPDFQVLFAALIAGTKAEKVIDEPGLEEIRQTILRQVGRKVRTASYRGKFAGQVVDAILALLQNLDDVTNNGPEGQPGESGKGEAGNDDGQDDDSQSNGQDSDQGGDQSGDDGETSAGDPGDNLGFDGGGAGDDESAPVDAKPKKGPSPDLKKELLEELAHMDESLRTGGIPKAAAVNEPQDNGDELEATVIEELEYDNLKVEVIKNPRYNLYTANPDHIHPQATQLASVIRRQAKFQAVSAEERYAGLRRGKLASKDAWKVATGASSCPFSGKTVKDKPKVNLVVAVDSSSSMNYSGRWAISMQLLDILDKAFDGMAGVQFWGIDFGYWGSYELGKYRVTEKVKIRILRQPNTRYKVDLRQVSVSGMTPTVPALKESYKLFPAEGQKILVLVTDGEPNIPATAEGSNAAIRQWMEEHRDVNLVQIILGDLGADVPHTIKVGDYTKNRTEQIVSKIGLLIGKALK